MGISTTIAMESVSLATLNPNYTVLIVSPSERQSNLVFKKIREFVNLGGIKLKEESATRLTFEITNSTIYSLPNSPKTIRGFTADMVYLDEFAFFDNQKEILQAVAPSISRGGRLTVISTPLGRDDEFFRIWNSEGWSKHKITWKECPHLNIQEIRNVLDEITFKREYEAEFIDSELMLYPPNLVIPCVGDWEIPLGKQVYGIDVGRTHNETAIIGVVISDNKYYVNYIRDLKNTPFEAQRDFILTLEGDKIIDSTGLGMQLAEELKARDRFRVEAVQFTASVKQDLMNHLRLLFEKQMIYLPKNEDLLNQLYSVQMEVLEARTKYKVKATEHHADKVIALALATKPIKKVRVFYKKPYGL